MLQRVSSLSSSACPTSFDNAEERTIVPTPDQRCARGGRHQCALHLHVYQHAREHSHALPQNVRVHLERVLAHLADTAPGDEALTRVLSGPFGRRCASPPTRD